MERGKAILLIRRLTNDLRELTGVGYFSSLSAVLLARYKNVIDILYENLSDHDVFLDDAQDFNIYGYCLQALDEIEELLKLDESTTQKIDEGKIFASSEDKIKQAGASFRNQDYPGVFNSLNTALELMLKDKLQIPTTITDINTSNIIDILVSEKLGPIEHLKEMKKRLFLDGHTKHRGYIPQPNECVHALKAMEDLRRVLEPMTIPLDEKTKDKIYSFVQDHGGGQST